MTNKQKSVKTREKKEVKTKLTSKKMNTNVKSIAVIVQNKQNKCYQVALTESEIDAVMHFISTLHDGKIKASNNELPLQLVQLG